MGRRRASGDPSEAQQANNAEVDQARKELQQGSYSRQDIIGATQPFAADGFTSNPNYDPYLARTLAVALQHKTGADDEFGSFHQQFGPGGAAGASQQLTSEQQGDIAAGAGRHRGRGRSGSRQGPPQIDGPRPRVAGSLDGAIRSPLPTLIPKASVPVGNPFADLVPRARRPLLLTLPKDMTGGVTLETHEPVPISAREPATPTLRRLTAARAITAGEGAASRASVGTGEGPGHQPARLWPINIPHRRQLSNYPQPGRSRNSSSRASRSSPTRRGRSPRHRSVSALGHILAKLSTTPSPVKLWPVTAAASASPAGPNSSTRSSNSLKARAARRHCHCLRNSVLPTR